MKVVFVCLIAFVVVAAAERQQELELACKNAGKTHKSTGMLNMETCKAQCVGADHKVTYESLPDGSKCLCAEHGFKHPGVCQSGKCIHKD